MKCKTHPYEPGVGVCPSCLRLRLLALLDSTPSTPSPPHFPLSVPPYVPRPVDPTPPPSKPRFSLLSALFPSRSDESNSNSSWIKSFFTRRKRRRRRPEGCRLSVDAGCRGMSPDLEEVSVSESASAFSVSEFSSPAWRIPAPTPARWGHRRCVGPPRRTVSGFTVCLSPMMRPSPQRRSQVGSGEDGISGEIRAGRGGPTGLVQNRSRKLADFGRFQ